MPQADERSALELPDATPVIHTLRVTHGIDHQPLILEELRTSGHQAQLNYRITADSPRTLRAVPNRDYYLKKRGEGCKHVQAVIALARRRVNVLWALLRDGRLYSTQPPLARPA